MAEFSVEWGVVDGPDFNRWLPYKLRKRDSIIESVNSHVSKWTHKYGIKLPTTTDNTKRTDEKNEIIYWNIS